MKKVWLTIIDDESVSLIRKICDESGSLNCDQVKAGEFEFALTPELFYLQDKKPIGKMLEAISQTTCVTLNELLPLLSKPNFGKSAEELQLIFLDLKWNDKDIWVADTSFASHLVSAQLTIEAFQSADYEVQTLIELKEEDKRLLGKEPGLALALWLLRANNWRGLLCVASGTNSNKNKEFLRRYAPHSHGNTRWYCLEADIRTVTDGLCQFVVGVKEFLKQFGANGLIRWWLVPSIEQDYWFVGDYHNPTCDSAHYMEVAKTFGADANWESDLGKYSKILFEVPKNTNGSRAILRNNFQIKAGLILKLFPNAIVLDGVSEDDTVSVPIYPALPFLYAAKHALDRAREENGDSNSEYAEKPYVLKRIHYNQVALALRQSKEATGLVTLIKNSETNQEERLSNMVGLFRQALKAKVDVPPGLEASAAAHILSGCENPVADVEWDASSGELRIFWPINNQVRNGL